ncbi:hypothetical protein [Zwartia sp.]|uniref:hypothetical protein n=1 Tax=Zwartia sp. TaxID=2978004 RepID=UPI003BAFE420
MFSTPPGATHQKDSNHRPSIGAMVLFAVGVAIAWVGLFQLNIWLFSEIHLTGFISWIFLPAAIRMLAVMIGGWSGALGLFVGAILTNLSLLELEPFNVMILAALSALGPVIAVHLCTRWLQLPGDLSGLQRSQLLVFAVAGAVFNVFPHNLFFYMTGLSYDAWSGVLPMFVGDLAGTLIVLYVASVSIRMVTRSVRA